MENRWKALQNHELPRSRKFAENAYYHELTRELRGFGYPRVSIATLPAPAPFPNQELIEIFDHDFPSQAQGIDIPYGIYDTRRNQCFVCVGTTCDTSEFAVDSIRTWWLQAGSQASPQAEEILLLADCRGSNGYRNRLWKQQLKEGLCERLGLKVRAYLNTKQYTKGVKVSDARMSQIQLKRYRVNPLWNYSIAPRLNGAINLGRSLARTSHQEVSRPPYGLRRVGLASHLLRASLEHRVEDTASKLGSDPLRFQGLFSTAA